LVPFKWELGRAHDHEQSRKAETSRSPPLFWLFL
jgi:hypothetical protein